MEIRINVGVFLAIYLGGLCAGSTALQTAPDTEVFSVADQTDYEYVVFSGPVCGTPQLALEYRAPEPTTCQFMQDEPAAIYDLTAIGGVPTLDLIINVEWEGQLLALHVYAQEDYVEVFYPIPHPGYPGDSEDSWDPSLAPVEQEI